MELLQRPLAAGRHELEENSILVKRAAGESEEIAVVAYQHLNWAGDLAGAEVVEDGFGPAAAGWRELKHCTVIVRSARRGRAVEVALLVVRGEVDDAGAVSFAAELINRFLAPITQSGFQAVGGGVRLKTTPQYWLPPGPQF